MKWNIISALLVGTVPMVFITRSLPSPIADGAGMFSAQNLGELAMGMTHVLTKRRAYAS